MFSARYVAVLTIFLVVAAGIAGALYTKVQYLEKGVNSAGQGKTANITAAVQQQAQAEPTVPPVSLEQIKKIFSQGYLYFGDAGRKVLFVEIVDPSCPYCHIAGGENPQLSKSAGKFQYKTDGGAYVPPVPEMRKLVNEGKAGYATIYSNGHGNGRLAMQALYCAHEKGKFWEAHDLLMNNAGYELINNQVQNDKAKAGEIAQFLQKTVEPAFMTDCLSSEKYLSSLSRDEETAQNLGFRGTPHFFVNTTQFNGAYSFDDMKSVVDVALK